LGPAITRLDVRTPDDRCPLPGIVGDEFPEVRGGARSHVATQVAKPYPIFGIGETCIDLLIELVDTDQACCSARQRQKTRLPRILAQNRLWSVRLQSAAERAAVVTANARTRRP